MNNNIVNKISGHTACPDRIIEALANNQYFDANFELACQECGVVGSDADITVEGWGFRVRPEACNCEFAGCEHEKSAEKLEQELTEKFEALCIKTCDFHYENMKNWDVDDYIENGFNTISYFERS